MAARPPITKSMVLNSRLIMRRRKAAGSCQGVGGCAAVADGQAESFSQFIDTCDDVAFACFGNKMDETARLVKKLCFS